MPEESCEDILKLKQIIIDEGLYEANMTAEDIQQVYKTLNRSKRTANDDNEYRELMSQTDLNCMNVGLLTPLKLNESDKTSDTEIVVSEIDKKFTSNNDNIKSNDDNIDIVFNFDATNSCTEFMPIKQNENLTPILYHQKKFLKLPVEKKMKVITSYLQYERAKVIVDRTRYLDQWDKPIILNQRIEFIEPFVASEEPEISVHCNIANENSENTNEEFISLRSNRLVKRKNYSEVDSDEEFKTVASKKIKSNNVNSGTVNKILELPTFNEEPSTSENIQKVNDDDDDYFPSSALTKKAKRNDSTNISKSTSSSKSGESSAKQLWLSTLSKRETSVQKYGDLKITPEVSDRTNKLLGKLKVEENKNKPVNQKMKIVTDSSDEELFSVDKNVNILTEVTPKLKKGKGITNKKAQTKTRKKMNLKSTNEEQIIENDETEITTRNFYGKNKENELDASNNNKITLSDMVQCPICSQTFSSSEIAYHASRCELYDDSEAQSLCTICNKYILNTEMDGHKFKCLKEITEESTEKSYDKRKNKTTLGFLCNVCDKYVKDCTMLEHASNCIATVAE